MRDRVGDEAEAIEVAMIDEISARGTMRMIEIGVCGEMKIEGMVIVMTEEVDGTDVVVTGEAMTEGATRSMSTISKFRAPFLYTPNPTHPLSTISE
jgi:hypothetical protein